MEGLGSFGLLIPLLTFPLFGIVSLVILYLIIRLAVRHGIESSNVAAMLREKMDKKE